MMGRKLMWAGYGVGFSLIFFVMVSEIHGRLADVLGGIAGVALLWGMVGLIMFCREQKHVR